MSEALIRNCKLKFKCRQKWSDMEEVSELDDYVKHCKVCNEDVHLCDTDELLNTARKNNWCVALYDNKNGQTPTLIGEVVGNYGSPFFSDK